MGGSQLKQLKTSLRENGILGAQKSKKQRKASNKDAQKRLQRNAALEGIRERFNPFEAKAPARREKFDIASNKPTKKTVERPGVTRGLGEERRRATLLKEMQSRNKVGGMLDRRFGEDDPNMTPEQKAAERFAQQALRTSKKTDVFNLEGDSEDELQLTHGGRALELGGGVGDDFDEEVEESDADEFDAQDDRPRKRVRLGNEEEGGEDVVQRRKSKHEVMQEVIAKSKMYKAARQAAKEDDDDLRLELDKGMGEFYEALRAHQPQSKQLPSPPGTDSEPSLDPGRAAMLAGKSREEAEKEYEANLREMKLEARSRPSTRTKTEEEKAAEEKARLEDLERKRLRRMNGEAESSEDEEIDGDGVELDDEQDEQDDAEAFGLQQPESRYMPQLEVEDEDEFVMDDIVASDSDAEPDGDALDEESSELEEMDDDGDDDFINGLVLPQRLETTTKAAAPQAPNANLAFTFPCPQTHSEFLEAFKNIPPEDLPTVVQRIRALYHKGLASDNPQRLTKFAEVLVNHIIFTVNRTTEEQFSMCVVEQLIRHLHSMAKSQPHDIASIYRNQLRRFQEHELPLITPGDLVIFTAIATTFPTSDQWHPVVTPAILIIARYLAQGTYETLHNLAMGAYLCSLAFRYQKVSNRYLPETINFICKGIDMLAPNEAKSSSPVLCTPTITASQFRIRSRAKQAPSSMLSFNDIRKMQCDPELDAASTINQESLLQAFLHLIQPALKQNCIKSAYPEIMAPIYTLLTERLSLQPNLALLHSSTRDIIKGLVVVTKRTVDDKIAVRKPLFLHNHRPRAIKSSYPAFLDDYNPTRRYHDPDHERAELNKLKAEHKKERKGAMRELRKDANFVAREQLREKKAKDEAYEKKYKRLVAEIQGEEGKEAKDYEREKAKRKGKF
ncbi:nucleolar complex protein 14 [Neophaeococcomyces mojaviensis]|uniref:Nucleolar complex protein 14 n=1 Tax=Neophaeococcomyces mojaviensis TaxID=3383035 RepID=A0ACC2ZTN8_9EURO|nr:nucleolar complex protein 14 [Knufia sp. JES_112]